MLNKNTDALSSDQKDAIMAVLKANEKQIKEIIKILNG